MLTMDKHMQRLEIIVVKIIIWTNQSNGWDGSIKIKRDSLDARENNHVWLALFHICVALIANRSFSNDDGDGKETALENKYLRNRDYSRLSHFFHIL